jgi:hypothetical protein
MTVDDHHPRPNGGRRPHFRKGRTNHAHCDASGKRRFRDRHDAGLELRRLSRSRARLDVEGATHSIRVVRSYECGACGGWHLTSRPEPPAPVTVPAHRPVVIPAGLVPEPFRTA